MRQLPGGSRPTPCIIVRSPEIMIPLVATSEELRRMRDLLEPVSDRIIEEAGIKVE